MWIRGRYELVRRLGAGGGGSVYEVRDRADGDARLALKALFPAAGDQALVAALRAEFATLATVRHPRLCRVYDFGRLPEGALEESGGDGSGAGLFLTRELVDGVDLHTSARRAGDDLGRVIATLAEAARGLEVLHRAGIRHGDFKPANAIVTGDGTVKLIDFGLAEDESTHRSAGTLAYMAPELLAQRPVDRRADLYALGIALFELVGGVLPCGDRRGAALIRWHLASERPRLSAHREVSPALDRLASALIARDPEERLPSAAEAAAALDDCARELGVEAAHRAVGFVVPVVQMPQVAALERAFERRRWGKGGSALVCLRGARGAGRSAVLTELAWRVELAGAEVVRAASSARARPLGCFGAAVQQLAALVGSRPEAPAGVESRFESYARVARWLANVGESFPVVVAIDDLDTTDEVTRELASYLAFGLPAAARVLIVGTVRELASDRDGGVGEVPTVAIAPLSRADVTDMVARAAGRDDPQLAARIHRHTQGNLASVVHTMEVLADRGFPAADNLDGFALPPHLARVAADDVADAPAQTRRVLAALGVLGRPASDDVVRAVLGDRGGIELSPWLTRDRGVRLQPARIGLGQAAAAALDEDTRAAMHRRAADALVEGGRPVDDPEVAWHLCRAGDAARARAAVDAAMAALREAGDLAGALDLGQRTLSLVGDDDDLRLAVGELARAVGDRDGAERALSALAAGDIAARGPRRARHILGRACEEAGEVDRAETLWSQLIDGAPVSDEAALAARELSRLLIKRGRAADALVVAERALGEAREAAPDLEVARLFALGTLGRDDGAAAGLEAAAERAASEGNDQLAATAFNYSALLSFRAVDYHGTQRRYRLALAAAERAGDLVRVGTLRMNIASLAFHQGDYGGCLEELVHAVSLLRAARAETPLVLARRNLGHLLVDLGEYEQARVELRIARGDAEQLRLTVHVAGTTALLGIADVRSGATARGFARLEEARAAFLSLADRVRAGETEIDIAELAVDVGDPVRARAALDRARAADMVNTGLARRARVRALEAHIAAAGGDAEGARAALADLTDALFALREQGARHASWDLWRRAGLAREALGDSGAANDLRAALACADDIAATLPDAHRAAYWHDPRRRALRATEDPAVSATVLAAVDDNAAVYRLLEIYRRMSLERAPARLIEMAMDSAVELSGAERGFLLLADEAGALSTAAARNMPEATVRALHEVDADPTRSSMMSMPYSRTVAERAFHDGEVVLSNDPLADPRLGDAASVHARRLESVVGLPIRRDGTVVGVLYLESRFRGAGFSDADVRMLLGFADQVAILLANARLLEENARRADELENARGEIEHLLAERTAMLDARTHELAHVRRDLASVRRRFLVDRGAFGLIGRSPAMERVFQVIERLAATEVPVMVLGESGTGKELVARALHEYGPRKDAPLVSINCGALPEQLLESELFGHVRGAFTGADRDRRGLFETAGGGTLFLDELGEMPARMQASLLRALQEKLIRRVGGVEDIAVDVRIVCATNRDLEAMVDAGTFRQDLYYRLCVVPVQVPALRERADDIPLLVEHFVGLVCERIGVPARTVEPAAMRALMAHHWPGNVRQLEHAITNALVMSEGESLGPSAFDNVLAGPGAVRAAPPTDPERRRQRERQRMLDALEASGWNKSKAARLLQMPRRTFYRRLDEYDIR